MSKSHTDISYNYTLLLIEASFALFSGDNYILNTQWPSDAGIIPDDALIIDLGIITVFLLILLLALLRLTYYFLTHWIPKYLTGSVFLCTGFYTYFFHTDSFFLLLLYPDSMNNNLYHLM